MAKQLGYSVVAEGVETKKQADELSEIGVNCSQGYYFSYPMTIDELSQWYDDFKQGKLNDFA
jgi:EAL domain-containing protein (putative c-di-GMP-specific phosphodiesterase class I)